MKTGLVHSLVIIFAACTPALSAQSSPSPKTTAASSAKSFEAAAVVPPALSATVVEYGERDVLRLKAKLRYTTLIVLPKNEQILDFTCGDKEFWIVNGTQNFAYVKPARANSQTNLNLITASGNVYSFVLSEVSGNAGLEPDLKVFVQPKDGPMTSALNGAPKFVSAAQVEDYRQQIEMAKEETRQTKNTAQSTIDHEVTRFRSEYPTALKFVYHFNGWTSRRASWQPNKRNFSRASNNSWPRPGPSRERAPRSPPAMQTKTALRMTASGGLTYHFSHRTLRLAIEKKINPPRLKITLRTRAPERSPSSRIPRSKRLTEC